MNNDNDRELRARERGAVVVPRLVEGKAPAALADPAGACATAAVVAPLVKP